MQCGPWRSIIFLHRVPPTANPQIQCLGRCFFFKPGFESVCFWMFFEFLSKLSKRAGIATTSRQYESVLVSNLTCFLGCWQRATF